MQYAIKYESLLGGIMLAADEISLTGLWFEGQKYFALCLEYFSGNEPNFNLSLHFTGSIFQNEVWEIL